jgi:hypothetical protein
LSGNLAFDVGSEVAGASCPLDGGLGSHGAEGPVGEVLCPGATLAVIDDRMATAAVKGAPFTGHERAFRAVLKRYALHGSFLLGSVGGDGFSPRWIKLIIYHELAKKQIRKS